MLLCRQIYVRIIVYSVVFPHARQRNSVLFIVLKQSYKNIQKAEGY